MAALPTSPPIPVEEYLNTSYDPDVEYVDGILMERNVGDWLHSLIQSNVLFALRRKYPQLKVVAELRTKVTDTRFRLPDVCALLAAPETKYLPDAAYLVAEVLSEGDDMSLVIEKLREYDRQGVRNIWLIDPRLKMLSVYRHPVLHEIDGETIDADDRRVSLSRSDIFAE
jgi:Uma2 family endonuclease